MFDLERAIAEWKKALRRNPVFEDGHVAELEANLRDEIEELMASGRSPEDAFAEAARTACPPDRLGAELFKAHTNRRSGRPSWQPPRFVPALAWNYAKIAGRKMRRHKGFSFINIAGLAAGMACCILILLWVKDERSYDRFHANAGRIVRVLSVDRAGGGERWDTGSPAPLGAALVRDFPETARAARVQSGWPGWNVHRGDLSFPDSKLAAVDPEFFEIFRFPFLAGDSRTALRDLHSIVLAESLARKLFGGAPALGQTVQIYETDMRVTGIIRDIPANSHLRFDYAFPLDNMRSWRESQLDSWSYLQCATYIELREGVGVRDFGRKIAGIMKTYAPESRIELALQPLRDIHLKSRHVSNFAVQYPNPGNAAAVAIFSLTAACVLLLACINFMNLATARFGSRAKEVGVRKMTGAARADLIRQFLGESILISLLALAAAVLLVILALPAFSRLSGKTFTPADLVRLPMVLGLLGIALATGLAAGSYPALALSAFAPARVLKDGARSERRRGGGLRKLLVVGQFAFTIVLLCATLTIFGQLRYIRNKDLGFDRTNIVSVPGSPEGKREVLQNPDVLSASLCFPPGPGYGGTARVDWEGKDPGQGVLFFHDMGDYDYLKTFGLTLVAGRYYSPRYSTDADQFIINEAAARLMGPGSPVGKKLALDGKTGRIIGVVKDYLAGPLHAPVVPKVIQLRDGFFLSMKFRPGKAAAVLDYLSRLWKRFAPGRPFRPTFLDQSMDDYYKAERRIGTIFQAFAGLAVLIAALGLFGMALFAAEQRTKEIGIRKTMGAGRSGLVVLLTREFVQWVLLANVIAWPAAYAASRLWLKGFAYRMSLGPGLFLTASGLALGIALLTVGYLAWRAASADPVKSLRYE